MMKLKNSLDLIKYYSSFLSYDLAKIYLTSPRKKSLSTMEHLKAGIQWICQAQDASKDGGVARSYSLVYNPYFKRRGWIPSYPETTGYIIPTMFDYAQLVNDPQIRERAIRMSDWESDVQMANGAVQGGTIEQAASPAIFNTGQVIFGWLRAYEETRNERYLDSAKKAGSFLTDQQEESGAWKKHLSNFASSEMSFYTYNTRTAWGLLKLAILIDSSIFKESAIRNIDFALGQQLGNGWFKSNCLTDPSQPLLHTIAYCIRGILESGILLKNNDYIDRAKKGADALIERQREDGSLAGRFNHLWEPTVRWNCLTGIAQISIIWGRLYQVTGEQKYLNSLKKANHYLKRVQLIQMQSPEIYGGITGSYPIHGVYGQYEILNWAVKFFMDALMLELRVEK